MADLGEKHICDDCETKYYDLGKSDATCPRCGSSNRRLPEDQQVSTYGRRRSESASEPEESESEEELEDLGEIEDDEPEEADEDDEDEDESGSKDD